MKMSKSLYRKRIKIPILGDQKTSFFTKGKLKIANGYSKILLEKKPIVEFLEKNIALDNLVIPHYSRWMESEQSDWIDYRSKDYCKVRVRFLKSKRLFFCSLFELSVTSDKIFIEELISP